VTARPKKPAAVAQDLVTCAQCGTVVPDTEAVTGRRFLTVENEWRPQTLCAPCASRLGPTQYRRDV
jgi:hypothetical protein